MSRPVNCDTDGDTGIRKPKKFCIRTQTRQIFLGLFAMTPAIRHAYNRALRPVLALFATASVAACAANVSSQSSSEKSLLQTQLTSPSGLRNRPVKIGMLLPLAGLDQSAAVAKSLKQSAEMALFERDDPNVQLIVKDAGGTEAGAQAAATLAIADGAEILIGPLFARAVPGAATVARQAGIPVLALSNDANVAGGGVYLMSFLAEQEVDRIVEFSIRRGKRQFAALIPENSYGALVEDAFRGSVARHGGAIRILERYPMRTNAMLKPAQRVVQAIQHAADAGLPIDALFVPGGRETLPNLGPILAYSGINANTIQLLGTGAWDYPNIGREAAFIGGWHAGPDPSAWRGFSERFARTFGQTPPRIATLSYDAVNFAITLASRSDNDPFSALNITGLNGHVGIDGLVRLTPEGLPLRSLAILEVQKFSTSIVDPAPSSLELRTVSSVTY